MVMTAAEIAEIHRAFGASEVVVLRRRNLYAATIEVASAPDGYAAVENPDILDSPVARGHLGEVLCGRESFAADRMFPLSGFGPAPTGSSPRIASSDGPVQNVLDPQLQALAQRTGADLGPILLPGSGAFGAAADRIVEGTRLLERMTPCLAGDVLPHIALIAVVPGGSALGSASFRELPGLVVLPEPQSAFEVAEALVHEGAHQRFFDLGVTASLLRPSAFAGPRRRASWSPATSKAWPIEQCLAAFHAYRCLGALELARAEIGERPHDFSLLPHAAVRGDELGRMLEQDAVHLGADGRRLVALLNGHDPGPAESEIVGEPLGTADVVRHCGDRRLLAFAESPIRLVWQPALTAAG